MSNLFSPIKVGTMQLEHRIVMAPLTRFRADNSHCHTPLATVYYSQRAKNNGGLLITEATYIDQSAGGFPNVPGIYTDAQVKAWKEIVDAVHAQGSKIYLQLWALGRAATGSVLKAEGFDVVSSSNVGLPLNGPTRGDSVPRPLTIAEIKLYQSWYARAATNFVKLAGGDGVEVHGGNGYLIDQFTQTTSNTRTDAYGGSIENRVRFGMEVTQAVVDAVGAENVGVRITPHSEFQGMKMSKQAMEETFTYFVKSLKHHHPQLAYLHVTEPRVGGGSDQAMTAEENIEFIHEAWGNDRPIIVAGGYTAETSKIESAKRSNALIGLGRYWISNPDTASRIKNGHSLNPWDRKTFYTPGPNGYTNLKSYEEEMSAKL